MCDFGPHLKTNDWQEKKEKKFKYVSNGYALYLSEKSIESIYYNVSLFVRFYLKRQSSLYITMSLCLSVFLQKRAYNKEEDDDDDNKNHGNEDNSIDDNNNKNGNNKKKNGLGDLHTIKIKKQIMVIERFTALRYL